MPFNDSTNQTETYSGGRYLIDTIKGVDPSRETDQLVVDFNFAYNPSCAYNERCYHPLASRQNQLQMPIQAGELKHPGW